MHQLTSLLGLFVMIGLAWLLSLSKRRFPWRKVEQIETDIAACETRIEELHFALADPNTFRDPGALRSVKSELDDQNLRLQELYEHWEEAAELN